MYDIIIIGSGPAGLSAAIYAKREMLNCVIIEKIFYGTGQIAESERVDNYPGLFGENGFELGAKFRAHAEALGAEFLNGEVTAIERCEDIIKVKMHNGEVLETKAVIYCAGAKPKTLDIKGEKELIGKGVSYCAVCDGAFYKQKTVCVVGGGDTALQDAVLLSKVAKTVYLIHRREEFRANMALQSTVKGTPNIELILNAVPTEIVGDNKVEAVKLLTGGEEKLLTADGVFVAVGSVPQSSLLKGIAELDGNGYVIADESGSTSARGIFAAGDVRTKQLRQVVTAVSDGANCVISAEKYISKKL